MTYSREDAAFAAELAQHVQQMVDNLNRFWKAPTDDAALRILQQHPEVGSEAAVDMLEGTIQEARDQGEYGMASAMSHRLDLLRRYR